MSQPKPKLDDLRIERPAASGASNRALPWIIVIVALLVVGGLAARWFARPGAIPVRTAVARAAASAGPDRTVLNASGYVVARREATVSSKIMGKVTEILVEEGVKVQLNQVLARLDDTNVQASLRLAQAQAKAAEASQQETRVRLKEAELDLQRQTALRTSNVAAQADLDRAEATANALRARLAQQQIEVTVAERSVAVIQQQLDDAIIRAPFTGIVTSKNAQPGEMISPMSSGGFTRTGICTIVDMESLEVEIDVNESYINRVAPGQAVEATLDAYPEWKIPCKVIAIIPTADRQKSTVRVRVGFDKLDPRVLPQMAVKVAFREAANSPAAVSPSRGVIVPKGAVASREGRDVVFVVQAGRVERRAVTVASTVGTDTTLSTGLAANERIVVDPPAEIADGVRVEEKKL